MMLMTPRKSSIALFLTVAFFITAQTSQAVDVYTDPVGFYKVSISSGANVISAPLQRTHDYRGLVASVTSSTVTVSGAPGWTANQFGPKDGFSQYIVLLRQDASASPGNEGDWWTVISNTSNSLTLDVGIQDLTTVLGAGDNLEIRHLTSLADLCGPSSSTIMAPDPGATGDKNVTDVIRFFSPSTLNFTAGIISYIPPVNDYGLDPGYYIGENGPYDGSTITFAPGTAFVYNRLVSAGATNIVSVGQVQTKKITNYLLPGANAVGNPFPAGATLSTSGLLESGWDPDKGVTGDKAITDVIRVFTGINFTADIITYIPPVNDYSIEPAGWYAGDTLVDSYQFQPGKGYVLFVKGPLALRWRQAVPFTP